MKQRQIAKTDDSLLIDIKDACIRYQVGESKMRKIAEEANAVVRIGRSVRVVQSKMDEYLLKQIGD